MTMSYNAKIMLLEKLKVRILQEISDHLALLVTTERFFAGNDVDLFAILDNAPINDPYNVEAYIKLIEAVKTTEKEIKKENKISVVDFSTFRIEHYHCKLMHLEETGAELCLHIMVYPTIAQFLSWENHSIILSICSNYTLLYGHKNLLDKIRASIKTDSFEHRIQPLVSLLFETYRNIIPCTTVPEETKRFLLGEGLKKLEYVIRFILWELLRENVQGMPSPEPHDILNMTKGKDVDRNLAELLRKVKDLKQTEIAISDVKMLYELCMFRISELVCSIRGSEKNVHLR